MLLFVICWAIVIAALASYAVWAARPPRTRAVALPADAAYALSLDTAGTINGPLRVQTAQGERVLTPRARLRRR